MGLNSVHKSGVKSHRFSKRLLWIAGVIVWGVLIAGCTSTVSNDAVPSMESKPNLIPNANTITNPVASNEGAPAKGAAAPTAVSNTTDTGSRKVIYKANVTMQVADYSVAQTEINDLVANNSGYLLQFVENPSTTDLSGTFVFKIPADGFSSFITALKEIPTLTPIRHNIQGQDISEEYVDLTSRIEAKEAVEARLLTLMENAEETDALLAIFSEMAKVQEAIEQLKGRLQFLDQIVDYSTIEIHLYQKGNIITALGTQGESFVSSLKKALTASLPVMVAVSRGILIVLAALLPILITCTILGFPVIYLYRRNRKKRLAAARSEAYNQIVEVEPELKD